LSANVQPPGIENLDAQGMHFIVCQGGNFTRWRLVGGRDETLAEKLRCATQRSREVATIDCLDQAVHIAPDAAAPAPDLQKPIFAHP
jgi:hypothetical protein